MTRSEQRRRAASRLVLLVFVLTLVAGAALLVPVTRSSTSQAVSPLTTVTSDLKAWKWDPTHPRTPGQFYDEPRSVTIDQTDHLVSQVVHVTWQDFSASSNTNSTGPGFYPVHVYECDNVAPTDPGDCYGDVHFIDKHPGYGLVGDQTNAIQTFTRPDGSGGVDFDVLTGADNPALGCDPTHQCSLVIVPWAGGKPAEGANPSDCNDHSLDLTFRHGDGLWANPGGAPLNVGCDWAARITVPLSFNPTPSNCPARNADLRTEGSPMLRRAIDQWRSGICNGGGGRSPLEVGYTGLSEYQARSDFDRGAVDVGLTSRPIDSPTRKFAYAPVGVSGIAIAYYVDDPMTGEQITDLKLSPLLLAKMLTQSYTDGLSTDCSVQSSYACAPEVKGNPASIFDDKEFQALNPQYQRTDFPFVTQGNSSPNVVYGLSDNTYQLTSWLESDPEVASFLAGHPDQYGMHVNTAYLPSVSPKYPIDSFNANDPGHTLTVQDCGTLDGVGEYSCLVGGLQNNWFPINGLDNVAATLVNGKNTAKQYRPVCDGNNPPIRGVCTHYVSAPAEPLGTRGLFAIVDSGDAAAYQFPTAQLETRTGSNAFVSMTPSTMAGAVAQMRTNADGTTQSLDYSSALPASVYPLTSVNYAMAPTCGLTAHTAASVASLLDYVSSTTGNTIGVAPGQLAPGYLPLTAAMRAKTHQVAGTIASQGPCPAPSSSSTSSSSTSGSGSTSSPAPIINPGNPNPAGGPIGNGPAPSSGSSPAPTTSPAASGSTSPAPSTSPAAARLASATTGAPAFFLPVILCVGAALLLAGPLLLIVNKRGAHRAGRG